MALRLCSRLSRFKLSTSYSVIRSSSATHNSCGSYFQATRSYARGKPKPYLHFPKVKPSDENFFRKATKKEIEEEEDEDENYNTMWKGSEDEIKRLKLEAKERTKSSELLGSWSGTSDDDDEENALWTGGEEEEDEIDNLIPSGEFANIDSEKHYDKVFEHERKTKFFTWEDVLPAMEDPDSVPYSGLEPEELSPGKQARKVAVENALKKLKRGLDGRFTNVLEVMSDVDVLIGAFDNIVSGPEYGELREGGPKRLNMEFFEDIQRRMRDPNFRFSSELKLRPKSILIKRKKWQRAQLRRKKNTR